MVTQTTEVVAPKAAAKPNRATRRHPAKAPVAPVSRKLVLESLYQNTSPMTWDIGVAEVTAQVKWLAFSPDLGHKLEAISALTTKPEQTTAIRLLLPELFVSWDIEESEGHPIPVNAEGLAKLSSPLILAIFGGWINALKVPPPDPS